MAPASEERRGVPAADERAEVKAPEATGANGGDPWPARAARADSRRQESTPQPPLLAPVHTGSDGHQVSQNNGIAAPQRRRQKQDRLLNVGGQVEQADDLADARSRNLAQRGQGAVAGDLPRTHQFVQTQ